MLVIYRLAYRTSGPLINAISVLVSVYEEFGNLTKRGVYIRLWDWKDFYSIYSNRADVAARTQTMNLGMEAECYLILAHPKYRICDSNFLT